MTTDYQRLFREVELKAGRQMLTPRDFQWLEKRMFEDIHETISASTLMRLWGYRAGGIPRQTTLDVLARYVGFEDYVEFCKAPSPLPLWGSAPLPPKSPDTARLKHSPKGGAGRGLWLALLLLAVVGGFALWHFTKRAPMEEGLPAGAKDMTKLIANPTCDTDKLDAWTFEHGGVTLAEDSTLLFYMKNFDVYQVIHGLPAGEYELRAKAWQLPNEQEAALYDYEHAEDKEDGCAGTTAEIYAGPFAHRVNNYVSIAYKMGGVNSDICLRFVCLDDSMRIGFRSNDNCRRFSRAVADDFRLFLIREAKSEAEMQELAALRPLPGSLYGLWPQRGSSGQSGQCRVAHPQRQHRAELQRCRQFQPHVRHTLLHHRCPYAPQYRLRQPRRWRRKEIQKPLTLTSMCNK